MLELASTLEATSTRTRLIKDWTNRNIDHTASATSICSIQSTSDLTARTSTNTSRPLRHPRSTKVLHNRDIDHPAFTTNASTSLTVSSNIYNLTMHQLLISATNTETILTVKTCCCQKLIDSWAYNTEFQHPTETTVTGYNNRDFYIYTPFV